MIAAQGRGVGDRPVDAGAEFVHAVGQDRDTAFARAPLAGRQVMERLRRVRRVRRQAAIFEGFSSFRFGSRQTTSSNSFTPSISVPIAMLVTFSVMNSSTTGT